MSRRIFKISFGQRQKNKQINLCSIFDWIEVARYRDQRLSTFQFFSQQKTLNSI